MYDAMGVARMVVWLTDEEHGDLLTNLKLQKLLYYLQGFWLAAYGAPLFEARGCPEKALRSRGRRCGGTSKRSLWISVGPLSGAA